MPVARVVLLHEKNIAIVDSLGPLDLEKIMQYEAILYTRKGTFNTDKTQRFNTWREAFNWIRQTVESEGFTNVSDVDDSDESRITARTPNGRAGRNVGSIGPYYNPNE
jgi:hypothetical protein